MGQGQEFVQKISAFFRDKSKRKKREQSRGERRK